jgi:hypothetical protein
MKKLLIIATVALSLSALRIPVNAQTPGWQYTQCTPIAVTLSTSFQKIATCISSASWPYTLATSWYIFPIGSLDVTINSTAPADINLQIKASGCTNASSAMWDYFQFIPNRRQLWHVNELLTLRAGPSLFPTGYAIDLYAKTSVTSSPPTLNVGSSDGTNLAIVVVNQPL